MNNKRKKFKKNLKPQRINNPMKKQTHELNSEFLKEEVQLPTNA
jgi:hypothetical protein